MSVELIWITSDAEKLIGYMARVSNPKADKEDSATRLIEYCIQNKHWSIFEMASMCVGIETTRDIARQILRHRSFHFQEFSQRYAEVLDDPIYRDARLQDTKNRQNSLVVEDPILQEMWTNYQSHAFTAARQSYELALRSGIAKEVARAVLPEGMTTTKMYMSGTVRDWIHYLDVRTGNGTQLEHRLVAGEITGILRNSLPSVFQACQQAGFIAGIN